MSVDTWAKVAQRQAQGMLAHLALADALAVLGEKRLVRQQFCHAVSEMRGYAMTRIAVASDGGATLPAQAVQPPQLGDLHDARACMKAWLAWETEAVAAYQALHDEAKDDAACASHALSLAHGAAREADRARQLLARTEG